MPLYPVAGCKFWISNLPFTELAVDAVAADYSGVAWVEVKKWTQMGSYGDSAQLINTDLIGEGRTKKQKGTDNAGSMANVFATDVLDAGQIRVLTASQDVKNYAFKVELNDKGPGVGALNSTRLMYGLVMQAQQAGGGPNTVQTLNATMEINSNITNTAATPGTFLMMADGEQRAYNEGDEIPEGATLVEAPPPEEPTPEPVPEPAPEPPPPAE